MKKAILLLALLAPALSYAEEAKVLICSSEHNVEGWDGEAQTDEKMRLTAYIGANDEIRSAEVKGSHFSDKRDLTPDATYRPRLARYQDYNRYSALGDAWCVFTPLLPKNLSSKSIGSEFTGFMRLICESGSAQTITMNCHVKP